MTGGTPNESWPGLLVDAGWLSSRLDRPNLRIVDTRDRAAYEAGHLPHAAHFDPFQYRWADTSPEGLAEFRRQSAEIFSGLGVDEGTDVVFYEENSGPRATRGVWLLAYLGHERAALLDGGLQAWRERGLPLTTEVEPVRPTRFVVRAQPDEIADRARVLAQLADPHTRLIDTREPAEYYGQKVRSARGGAIPGAIPLEWIHNLDPDGRFKTPDDLREMYESAGIGPDEAVIAYCQGGYRAAHSWVALKLAGYPDVRNYLGSWGEWGDRLELPIEQPKPPETPGG